LRCGKTKAEPLCGFISLSLLLFHGWLRALHESLPPQLNALMGPILGHSYLTGD
jgi:hypothetical protein